MIEHFASSQLLHLNIIWAYIYVRMRACMHAHVFVVHGCVGIRADVSVLVSRTKRIHCMCTLNRHNNSENSHRIESI